MNLLLSIVIHTANILGIFTDPFEFEGNYGPEVNPIRQKVFELVVSREALMKNLSDEEIRDLLEDSSMSKHEVDNYRNLLVMSAIDNEKEYGPTLGQLVTNELIEEIEKKQKELADSGVADSDFTDILNFIERYKDKKIFRFLRNNPSVLLNLDQALRDRAAREGKKFNFPILGSSQSLEGNDHLALKQHLIKFVFAKTTLELTKSQQDVKEALSKLKNDYLEEWLSDSADNKDLEAFSTPLGQAFFYWMYQALNLHLIGMNPEMIENVNRAKEIFAQTLGDPITRADTLKNKLIASNTEVLFTQESDALIPQTLDGLFHPIDRQNLQDGTIVLLRSDKWEPDYEIISIDDYAGFKAGRMNVILATRKESGQKFLLASCHGHSKNPEDGRLQIKLIMNKFDQLSDGNLQLFIGIDANTKTEDDVILFREHLDGLGLICTKTGPTTVKKRMVTAQHAKAGRFAIDEEDYLIALGTESGGQFQFSNVTVGFKEEKVDITQPLPNMHNQSDHYPVGAEMAPLVPLPIP